MQFRFFTVISTPRAGSNYLCGLLGSHTRAACHNEAFHPDEAGLYLTGIDRSDPIFDTHWRDENPYMFLARLFHETLLSGGGITHIGFKVLLNEHQLRVGLTPSLDYRPDIILLRRENKLEEYSSYRIASETGVWLGSEAQKDQHKVMFDAQDYWGYFNAQQEMERKVLSLLGYRGTRYLTMTYERLLEPNALTEITDFLGLPEENLVPSTAKMNSSNVLERFVNADEVSAFAHSIGKACWLGPDHNQGDPPETSLAKSC